MIGADIIIINRDQQHSKAYGVIVKTTAAVLEAMQQVKAGKAKVIVDTDTTLAYRIEP